MVNKLGPRSIPGPVPISFFLDVPSNARALFSTLNGQRPLRPAPKRASPYCVRSDDDYTIHQRALSLLKSHPSVAYSVTKPLIVWEDLYEYFDAYDLWIESPGVLFQVIGKIARINLARDKEIDLYATEWVYTNSTRLAVLRQGQDVIGSIFTKEDEEFFDMAVLTLHEKDLLAKSLNMKCHILNQTIDSLHVPKHKRQQQWGEGDYRTNRHSCHYKVPEDRELPHQMSSPGHVQCEMTRRARTRGNQLQQNFNLRRQDSYNNGPSRARKYASEEGQVLSRKFHTDAKSRPAPPDILGPYISDPVYNAFSTLPAAIHPEAPLGFGVYGPQPVYMLTSNVPHILPMNVHGAFGVPYHPLPPRPTHQSSPLYPRAEHANIGDREQALTYHNSDSTFLSPHLEGPSGAGTQLTGDSSMSATQQPQETNPNKLLKQFSSSTDSRTIWIGCLSSDILLHAFDRVLSVFSRCGNIEHWRTLEQKYCAFITFEDFSSVDRAIDTLNRYELEEGKFLKVERPRKRDVKGRQKSSTMTEGNQHLNRGLSFCNETGSSFRSKKNVVRRCSISKIGSESNEIKQPERDTTVAENQIMIPFISQAGETNIEKHSSNVYASSPPRRKSSKCKDDIQTAQNNEHHLRKSSGSKKKKKGQNIQSDSSAPNAIFSRNSGSPDNPPFTNGRFNGTEHVTSPISDSLLSRETNASQLTNSPQIGHQESIAHKNTQIQGSAKMDGPNDTNSDNLIASKSVDTSRDNILSRTIVDNASQNISDAATTKMEKRPSRKTRKSSNWSKFVVETLDGKHAPTNGNNSRPKSSMQISDNTFTSHKNAERHTSKNATSSTDRFDCKTLQMEINSGSKCHVKTNSNSSSECTDSNTSTLSDGPVSRASSITIQSFQLNRHVDADMMIPSLKQTPKNPKLPGQKKANDNGNEAISVGKTDSANKFSKRERPPTKSFTSSNTIQTSSSAKSSVLINHKENKELPPSPKLLLSDLTQWPVLGSSKPLAETNPSINTISAIKPLSDHLPKSNLLRRDSTASVLSTSSISCRLTNDGAGSPTGASKLWPIVKRWDKHPSVDQNKYA